MLLYGGVKATVLFSHRAPIAARNVVQPHRDFNQHTIQGQKKIEHLLGVSSAKRQALQLGRVTVIRLGHGIYSANTDSREITKKEIQTIDRLHRSGGLSVNRRKKAEMKPALPDAPDRSSVAGTQPAPILILRSRTRRVSTVGAHPLSTYVQPK